MDFFKVHSYLDFFPTAAMAVLLCGNLFRNVRMYLD